ncbi:MAG: hydroxysqualene dehydroxylase HpnE [Bryobacteraceae bacterium]
MTRVAVIGGGLAGMAASVALAGAGFEVDIFEARPFLGGRASSYTLPDGEEIDNCQHVLLPCCINLLDLYARLGVGGCIAFHDEIPFIEPGGRVSVLRPGRLPAPLHFTGSFLRLPFLDFADKRAVARGLAAILRERGRADLESITMLDWLREKRQTAAALSRFWGPVLVSAINEDLDRMAASHAFQVFLLGFLGRAGAARIGLPSVALGKLYDAEAWRRIPAVRLRTRTPVDRLAIAGGRLEAVVCSGERLAADFCVIALPPEKLHDVAPEICPDLSGWEHSPITGIHLWLDRPVTALPFAALLDGTIQWFFDKGQGRRLQLVVSASRSLVGLPRAGIVALAMREIAGFLPAAAGARLEKAHVVKEMHATFSARPGLEARRPGPATALSNLFLAGDWTRTGWPATMEGAVRSGYLAAEAVTAAAGRPARFLVPDAVAVESGSR